jgi:hypothetical protein
MLTTPERSHMMPASAPNTSGVENVIAWVSMPTSENPFGATAQASRLKMNATATVVRTADCQRPKPRASCTPPSTASEPATIHASGAAAMPNERPWSRLNVAVPSWPVNTHAAMPARMR